VGFGYAVYFTERATNRVLRWDPDSGDVDVVAGGTPTTEPGQSLSDPYGLAFSGSDLLISDKHHHRICSVRSGRLHPLELKDVDRHRAIKSDSPRFFDPSILASPTTLVSEPGGSVVCTFFDDHTIYRIHADGRLELLLGVVRNTPHRKGELQETIPCMQARGTPLRGPTGIVEKRDGTLFFVERDVQVVREYYPDRGIRSIFSISQLGRWYKSSAAPESGDTSSYHPVSPTSLALDLDERLHVCDPMHLSVLRVDLKDGTFQRVHLSKRSAEDYVDKGPLAIVFGPDGTAWLSDSAAGSIRAFDVDKRGTWSPRDAELSSVLGEVLKLSAGGMGLVVGK